MEARVLERTSLVDDVSEHLRRDIIDGTIRPGDRLRIGDLVERFGVSHIPIREALRKLETEGWITTNRQRQAFASPVDLEDLSSLYETRRTFECELSRVAIRERDASHVERARAALDELIEAFKYQATVDDHYGPQFWSSHEAFHVALLAPAVSAWTWRLLDQTWQSSERYVRLFADRFPVPASIREHESLFEAYSGGDEEALSTSLAQHLSRTEASVRDGYQALIKAEGTAAETKDDA